MYYIILFKENSGTKESYIAIKHISDCRGNERLHGTRRTIFSFKIYLFIYILCALVFYVCLCESHIPGAIIQLRPGVDALIPHTLSVPL